MDDVGRIELRRKSGPSLWAVVDLEDYESVSQHAWHADIKSKWTYAATKTHVSGRLVKVYMHRLLLEARAGIHVDHIDHDGLNNRRSNLRAATHSQNQHNRRPIGGRSPYKGVTWDSSKKRNKRWAVRINIHGRVVNIGRFATELEAALAYDAAASEAFGEFALLNFPNASLRAA